MIKTKIQWQKKMKFVASEGEHQLILDAKSPLGDGEGFTPKHLLAVSIAGCTGMDVVALMKKYKEPLESFELETDVSSSEGQQPAVFTEARVTFRATGAVTKEKLIEAVTLSQTKFCGVSAMLSKAFPIYYTVFLNDEEILKGQASF